tara:strand:+ start:618 stop:800 length:183 start_codon:yes stop_codon:yes gene_type:complete
MKVGDLVRLKNEQIEPNRVWIITETSVIRMSEGGVKVATLDGRRGMIFRLQDLELVNESR